MMFRITHATLSAALLGTSNLAGLPYPAVQITQRPPPGNYCNATRADALFEVNTRPGEVYFGQGIYRVNGDVVHVTAVDYFTFPSGSQAAQFPLPRNVLPDSSYASGDVFSTTSRYFDAAMNPTYENEIVIQCDTGDVLLIRNSSLDHVFVTDFEIAS